MRGIIRLTDTQLRICKWVGESRYAESQRNRRDPGRGPSSMAADARYHVRGAECECAAAAILNVFWPAYVGAPDGGDDVGGIFGVRSTDRDDGRLIVKPRDLQKGNRPFVLIGKLSGTFSFLGWEWAGVISEHWPLLTDYGDAAHFCPQRALRSLDEAFDLISRIDREWTDPAPSIIPDQEPPR